MRRISRREIDSIRELRAAQEIRVTRVAAERDLVNVLGNAALAGELLIALTNGFAPAPNQTFTILNVGGTTSGGFDNLASGAGIHNSDGSGLFVINYNGNNIGVTGYQAPPPTFTAWQNSRFTPEQLSDPTISGSSADFDRDGLSNLCPGAIRGGGLRWVRVEGVFEQ